MKLSIKIFLSLFTFVILPIILIIWLGYFSRDEVFILPYEFKGVVVVQYNVRDGIPKEIYKGRRIFRIPRSGILRTQGALETGFRHVQYVYEDGHELQDYITVKYNGEKEDLECDNTSSRYVLLSKTVVIGGAERRVFETFFVGCLDDRIRLGSISDSVISFLSSEGPLSRRRLQPTPDF